MMKRIVDISPSKRFVGQPSDLFTRYKPAFDSILRLNDAKNNSEKNKEFYIPDTDVDAQLNEVLNDISDTFTIMIGYSGIGKSTSLRNFFGFCNSTPVIRKDVNALIFPSIFNGYIEDSGERGTLEEERLAIKVKEELSLRIEAVCTYLEKNYPNLRKLFFSDKGQREMYSYLEETNSYVLEHLSDADKLNIPAESLWRKKLEKAYELERFICAITKLKYYMGKSICECNRIIIILDDIESLPYHVQRQFIMQYSRLFECLRNTDRKIEEKEFFVNMIIAMRPHTYRIMREYRAFIAFYVNRIIYKREMVDLAKLFQRKVEYYKSIIPHEKEDIWDSAYKVLNILTNKFHSRFALMIKNLSIWNTRDAIKIYERVLENRVWIQRNIDKTSSFVIKEDNYIFNNITVLRAIACGNYCLYSSDRSEEVPNILINTPDGRNYSFIFLSLFALFQVEEDIDSDLDYAYGKSAFAYAQILELYFKVFAGKKNIEDDVAFAISYAYEKKILRKGIHDTDRVDSVEPLESLKAASDLYISPRGHEILRMIMSDSVYMELCREEYFRDYNNSNNCAESSYELLIKGKQEEIFIDLLEILIELLDLEKEYIDYAARNNRIDIYKHTFGNKVLCDWIYNGIERSIEFSGNQDNVDIKRRRVLIDKKIKDIQFILDDCL